MTTPRCERINSSTPRWLSRDLTNRLTAPGVTCNSAAALRKLSCLAALSKLRNAFNGGRRAVRALSMTSTLHVKRWATSETLMQCSEPKVLRCDRQSAYAGDRCAIMVATSNCYVDMGCGDSGSTQQIAGMVEPALQLSN